MSHTYFRRDFLPEPISAFDLTHPHRPYPLARLARWLWRPVLVRWYRQAMVETNARIQGYNDREKLYLHAFHDTAARQMRMLADVERAHLARLWMELDAVIRGNG